MAENAWLRIPLADYEGHMEHVGQAHVLDHLFARALRKFQPDSVAILGAAGGNGLSHLAGQDIDRVVAVDINPHYLQALEQRYAASIRNLQVVCADLDDPALDLPRVSLVHAALIFEYVDVARLLARIREWLDPGGALCVVLQLENAGHAPVTPSPFASLGTLATIIVLRRAEEFHAAAAGAGFAAGGSETLTLAGGKRFLYATFTAPQFGGSAARV